MFFLLAATRYEVYMATSYEALFNETEANSRNNITSKSEVLVVSMNQPNPPYSKERHTINLRGAQGVCVFGLKVFDDADNESELSNLVSIRINDGRAGKLENEGFIRKLAIGVSIGIILLAITIVLLVVLIKKRKARNSFNHQTYVFPNKHYSA